MEVILLASPITEKVQVACKDGRSQSKIGSSSYTSKNSLT